MRVTLYCDASFDHTVRIGGWGVWLRSDAGRVVRGGPAPDYCARSYEAELAAIYAGAWLAVRTWPQTRLVLVRSDCDQALRIMDGRSAPRSDHAAALRLHARLKKLRREHGVRLRARWVKGHQRGNETDAWLNRRVDEIARDNMRRARAAARRTG